MLRASRSVQLSRSCRAIVDDRGNAGRAAGGVDPQDIVHVHGQEPLREAHPQIVLGRERDAPQIVQALDIVGRVDPGLVEPLAVEGRLEGPADRLSKPLELDLLDPAPLGSLDFFVPEWTSIIQFPIVDV